MKKKRQRRERLFNVEATVTVHLDMEIPAANAQQAQSRADWLASRCLAPQWRNVKFPHSRKRHDLFIEHWTESTDCDDAEPVDR